MSRIFWLSAAMLVFAASGQCRAQAQQQGQTPSTPPAGQSTQATSQTAAQAPAPQQDSLAEAARRAREKKKDAPKAAKVFTNDDLPTTGAISTVGSSSAATPEETAQTSAPAAGNDEKAWREKFANLHHKLDQDQAELDVMQREANVDELQYYGGDPQKAAADQMSQQPMGAEYNKKVSAIDAKKAQVEADKQAISDAEDDLRKSGGDPGWAR
jgi:hypothetical protein